MEDPRLDANAPANPEPDPAPSKIPLPIPWISKKDLPDVPLVYGPPFHRR